MSTPGPSPDPTSPARAGVEVALRASDATAGLRAVDVLLAQSDEDGALEALQGLASRWPGDDRVALRLLELLKRSGNAPAVRALARSIGRRRSRSPDVHFALGGWAESEGELVRAARSFARAMRNAPEDPDPVVRLARVYRRAGRPDLAERVTRRALGAMPAAAALHAALGYALVEAQRPVAAAAAFRQAVRREPSWAVYHADLAGALILTERWFEAAEAAQAALRIEQKSERALTAFAVALGRLNKRDLADRAYRQALAVSAAPTRIHGNYGLFLASEPARLMEAGRHLRVALEAHPDWSEVREALRALSSAP